jgi:23S rRNA pseudouridine2605 synthase
MTERLHKVLAHAGVASRRAAEQMIRDRRVRVNGSVVLEMGTQVDPERDAIEVDGRRLASVEPSDNHLYVALNKPLGVVSTASDPERRPTVVELVNASRRLYPVGRLDIDSEGLVLLTDDGELTFRLTQARFAVEKEYHVLVGHPDFGEGVGEGEGVLERMRAGVILDDGLARVVRTSLLRTTPRGALVRVVLVEGRKRQVRRMFSALGCVVLGLQRVRIGPLQIGDLQPGQHRGLTEREVEALRSTVGLDYRPAVKSSRR